MGNPTKAFQESAPGLQSQLHDRKLIIELVKQYIFRKYDKM